MQFAAKTDADRSSLPKQKTKKPTKGRKISSKPLFPRISTNPLPRANSLFWGRDKICVSRDNGFAEACARIKGKERAKKF